ncbi:MAG: dihydrodipicolinate synthase family protein [Chloroflexi bacterium]|nr:dihydrodipicolinate synthase family protein [Chloroflexota bacterium]
MLSGIFPPLPTPFKDDGALDQEALRANVEQLNPTGLSGYLALGSNSEAVHVTPDEASLVYATVCKAAAPDKVVIGGTGQFSTQATIEMTKRAADAGCAAALIITPFYYKNSMTAEALRAHYHAIADVSQIPVMIYNVPANTGFNIASSIVAEIAQHPNVIGMKDSAGDINQLAEAVRLTRSRQVDKETSFEVFSGNYGALLPGLTFGIVGAILAVANIAPNECVSIFKLFKQGQIEEAGQLHLRLLPVARGVTSQFGVPGLKAAMNLLGYHGGWPRLPLLPLGANQRSEVEKMLKEAELL